MLLHPDRRLLPCRAVRSHADASRYRCTTSATTCRSVGTNCFSILPVTPRATGTGPCQSPRSRPHLHRDRAHACRHICTGTGLTPVVTPAPGPGSRLPHLHRDSAHACHTCTGTGLTPAASATGQPGGQCALHAYDYHRKAAFELPNLNTVCVRTAGPCREWTVVWLTAKLWEERESSSAAPSV